MNAVVIGEISKYEGRTFNAKVAFGMAFVDFINENESGEAEIQVNPNEDYHPLNASISTNIANFTFADDIGDLVQAARLVRPAIIELDAEGIGNQPVVSRKVYLPIGKMVYMSDKPLFTSAAKKSDTSFVDGTYILASYQGLGTVLYWTPTEYDDMALQLFDGEFAVIVP